jgi:hypothetical protein
VSITEELLEWECSGSGSRKSRLTAVGIRCADHATPSIRRNLALTSPTCGGRLVGIVRLRTKATENAYETSETLPTSTQRKHPRTERQKKEVIDLLCCIPTECRRERDGYLVHNEETGPTGWPCYRCGRLEGMANRDRDSTRAFSEYQLRLIHNYKLLRLLFLLKNRTNAPYAT